MILAKRFFKYSIIFNKIAAVSVASTMFMAAASTGAQAQCQKATNVANPVAAGTSAFYVHKLQSDMMVAALGCGMRQQYNQFATSYQAELKSNSSELLTMFQKQHGSQAKNKHTSFLTSMANDASLRMASSVDYCADASEALAQLTSGQQTALERVAANYFTDNGVVAKRDDDCSQLSSLPIQ